MEKRIVIANNDFLKPGELRATALIETPYGFEPDDRLSRGRIKVAASSEAISAAAELERVPGRSYFLVVALGDSEHWGTNNNGDAFPYLALMGQSPADVPMSHFDTYKSRIKPVYGFKTFEQGHTFQEHENSNPKLRIGGVHQAFWNPDMHRVELICWIEHDLEDARLRREARSILSAIEERGWYGISMACKVPFDRCSVCGNLAPTKRQYCGHLKNYRLLRGILPDGTPVAMINDFPVFFDNSFVKVPAAPEARSLFKIARDLSLDSKEARHLKEAEMTKEIEPIEEDVADEVADAQDAIRAVYHDEPRLPGVIMDKLAGFELPEVALGMHKLGMALRPSELLELALKRTPPLDKAAALDARAFDVAVSAVETDSVEKTYKAPDPEKVARVVSLMKPFTEARSWHEPHYSTRLMKIAMRQGTKLAADAIAEPTDVDMAALSLYEVTYAAVGSATKQANALWRWSAPGIAGIAYTMHQNDQFAKKVDPGTGQAYGTNMLEEFAANHPIASTAGVAVLARKGLDATRGLFRR